MAEKGNRQRWLVDTGIESLKSGADLTVVLEGLHAMNLLHCNPPLPKWRMMGVFRSVVQLWGKQEAKQCTPKT